MRSTSALTTRLDLCSRRLLTTAAATKKAAHTVMVFGSSTGVGKTVISAGLCRASLREEQSGTCYIKPVQTGELDEFFIHLYANPQGDKTLFARTLYHWLPAMSPHLASRRQHEQNGPAPPSDADLLVRLQREMRAFIEESTKKQTSCFAVIETAGGVLSPSPTPTTLQADLYRSMRLPIILVADAKLGGITTTLTAFESLRLRGYTVQAIAMISVPDQDTFGNNLDTVQTHLERTLVPDDRPRVFSLSPLPPPQQMLHGWYRDNDAVFCTMLEHLRNFARKDMARMEEMSRLGGDSVWWPFTQHLNAGVQTFIESAHGDYFHVLPSSSSPPQATTAVAAEAAAATTTTQTIQKLIDGCASWWTQGVGHGNPDMALAIAEAAGRYGHVMFPSNLHPPAVQLARFMIGEGGPGRGWAKRVFFSDDGSTAMEVALKMALRLFEKRRRRGGEENNHPLVITQRDSYHGDTLGTMSASGEESVYTTGQHPWWRRCGVSIDVPLVYYKKGALTLGGIGGNGEEELPAPRDVMDVDARLERGEGDRYHAYIESFFASSFPLAKEEAAAALVIEPIMLGAGGLKFVDPLFQKVLVQVCKKRGIPVVFDEVAVGMWRLGPVSTISILKEFPDVAAYGKMLTGGYLPMALTLATEETFASFLGSNRRDALLHGHSYTANPLGCAAALEAVRIFENSANFDPASREMAPSFTPDEIAELSKLAGVENAMGMGSVLSVALSSPAAALMTVSLMRIDGVYARPLGSVVYVMPAPVTADAVRRRLIRVLTRCITKAYSTKATSAQHDVVV